MAIAQKPGRKRAAKAEAEAEANRFIAGASAPRDTARRPAMIRFDPALLDRVDRAARQHGVSRSAFVAFTLTRALDDREQGRS
jgi:hypothetical protein